MTHIFISHGVADGAAKAQALVQALEAAGHACWIAPRDVTAGRTYPAQIMAAVRDSGGVIVLVTPAANDSPDVLQEVNIGHSHRKTVVPVIVDGTEPCDDLAYYLSVRHQLPWAEPEALLPAILRALPLPQGASPAPAPAVPTGGPEVLSATEAIAAAAASEDGVSGTFELTVQSAGHDSDGYWLNSEKNYRDPRCLAIRIAPDLFPAVQERVFVARPQRSLDTELWIRVRVRGTARKRRIDFISGGKPTGHYYFQTHVDLKSAEDIEVID